MLTYCLKCKKDTQNVDSKVITKNGKKMLLSKCAVFGNKKTRFLNKQAKGILSSFGFKTPLNKIPLLGDIILNVISLNS